MAISIGAWLCPHCHHMNRILENYCGSEESFIAECVDCGEDAIVSIRVSIEYTAQKIEVEGSENE